MDIIINSGTQVRCQVQAQKHFIGYVEFGCGIKNMGDVGGQELKKTGGWVGFTRWNGKN